MSRGQAAGERFDEATRRVMPDEGVLHVHLLRHGSVEGFGERRARGHEDVPLSEEGRRQHERLVSWFLSSEPRPDRIVSSDLSRCQDLGQRLARATGLPLEVVPDLREQSMGAWEGRTWSDITAQHGRSVNDYWDDYVNARPPGGESLAEAAERIGSWWRAATATHDGSRLVLAVHSGVIRVLLCQALGLPLTEALRFSPAAASHTALQIAQAGSVLTAMGERPWLSAAPTDGPDLPRPPLSGTPRLALSGSAGTGKTTLGRRLAEALGLPFLEEGMRRRLEAGLDLHRLTHDDMRGLLLELWREQCDAEDAATGGFVADRSAADFIAFWIFYGFHHDEARTDRFMDEALARLAVTERVLLCPWGVLPLKSDGIRSGNRWVQFMFQSLVESVLGRYAAPSRVLRVPETTDAEQRFEAARAALR